jgi:hypothetical protein
MYTNSVGTTSAYANVESSSTYGFISTGFNPSGSSGMMAIGADGKAVGTVLAYNRTMGAPVGLAADRMPEIMKGCRLVDLQDITHDGGGSCCNTIYLYPVGVGCSEPERAPTNGAPRCVAPQIAGGRGAAGFGEAPTGWPSAGGRAMVTDSEWLRSLR